MFEGFGCIVEERNDAVEHKKVMFWSQKIVRPKGEL